MQFLPCFWARRRNSHKCLPHVRLDYFRSTNHVLDFGWNIMIGWIRKQDSAPCPLCLFSKFFVVLYKIARENKKKIDFLTTTLIQAINLAFHFFASRLFTTFQSYDTSRGILFDVNKIEWSPVWLIKGSEKLIFDLTFWLPLAAVVIITFLIFHTFRWGKDGDPGGNRRSCAQIQGIYLLGSSKM